MDALDLFLLSATWRPGIGDPTVIGWTITVGYFMAAFACLRQVALASGHRSSERAIKDPWGIIVFLSAALGLNKQLDLQTLLIQWGRAAAISEHWYQDRRTAQFLFATVLPLLTFLAASLVFRHYRAFVVRHWILAIGLGMVSCYCLLRAAAIDHLGFGSSFDRRADRDLWALELLGVTLMLAGAIGRVPFSTVKGSLQTPTL